MLKGSSERWGFAPQSFSASTSTIPRPFVSLRIPDIFFPHVLFRFHPLVRTSQLDCNAGKKDVQRLAIGRPSVLRRKQDRSSLFVAGPRRKDATWRPRAATDVVEIHHAI